MLDAGFEAHHLYTNNAINANVVEKGVTDGFMLMIYGTSTGSLSIEHDGVGVGGSDLWAVAHSPNGGATYTPKTDNG